MASSVRRPLGEALLADGFRLFVTGVDLVGVSAGGGDVPDPPAIINSEGYG